MKNIYIYLGLLLTPFSIANAQEITPCTASPNCNDLGYTSTTADCLESVKCPFDTSKVFCIVTEVCQVGSILYSDKTCSKTVRPNKRAIAVVFDSEKKLAIALEEKTSTWSPSGRDAEDIIALSDCTEPLTCNIIGKSNTSKIVSQYGNNTNYAAGYCANYVTQGTNKGDWYLPSMGELNLLYKVKSVVNATLRLLDRSVFSEYYHWSSNEYGYNSRSWELDMRGGYGDYGKNGSFFVIPVLAY